MEYLLQIDYLKACFQVGCLEQRFAVLQVLLLFNDFSLTFFDYIIYRVAIPFGIATLVVYIGL